MPAFLAPLAVGAGLQAVSGIMSYLDQKKAERQAAELARTPVPRFEATPQLLEQNRMATNDLANPQGYSPAERGRFGTILNRILASQKYNANQMGGTGVARGITALGNVNATNAATDFAANDANLIRQNRNQAFNRYASVTNTLQNIQDRNTQNDFNRRTMQEQALGNAIRTNKDAWRGMLTGVGQDLVGAGATLATGGAGGKTLPSGRTIQGVPLDINANPSRGFRLNNRFSNYRVPVVTEQAPIDDFGSVDYNSY